jgi:hypothetical protein
MVFIWDPLATSAHSVSWEFDQLGDEVRPSKCLCITLLNISQCFVYEGYVIRFSRWTGYVDIYHSPVPRQFTDQDSSPEKHFIVSYDWNSEAQDHGEANVVSKSFVRPQAKLEDKAGGLLFFVFAEYGPTKTVIWEKAITFPASGPPVLQTIHTIVRDAPISKDRFPTYPVLETNHAHWLWWLNADHASVTLGSDIGVYVVKLEEGKEKGQERVLKAYHVMLDLGEMKPSGFLSWDSVDLDVHSGRLVAPEGNKLFVYDFL